MKLLLATNNDEKIIRFKKLLNLIDPSIETHSPKELGIEVADIIENGATLRDNAELKAKAYLGKTDMPILANDTGFYVEGEGFIDAPKRIALGDMNEQTSTKEEIAKVLLNFWKAVATRHGGKVNAAWIESFVLISPDGKIKSADSQREIVLTDQEFGKGHLHMPVRALYYSKATNKPAILHTEEEEIVEMIPVTEALKQLLK